jgi:hypothetical protein
MLMKSFRGSNMFLIGSYRLQLRIEGTLNTITQQWEYRSVFLAYSTTVDTRTKQKKQVSEVLAQCEMNGSDFLP